MANVNSDGRISQHHKGRQFRETVALCLFSPVERRKHNTDTCQCPRVVKAHRAIINMARGGCNGQTCGFENTRFRDLANVRKRGESWWLSWLGVGGGTVKFVELDSDEIPREHGPRGATFYCGKWALTEK